MSTLVRGIVATAAILALCPTTADAFNPAAVGDRFACPYGVRKVASSERVAASSLFAGRDKRRSFSFGADDRTSRPSLAPLSMAEGEADKEVEEAAAEVETTSETSASGKSDDNNRSGFVTALLLGPPLILKFIIVLVVKFLTDLVVFPLLFLYRLASRAKSKILSIFGKGGDRVNGDDGNGGDIDVMADFE